MKITKDNSTEMVFEGGGYEIEIGYDDYAINPRDCGYNSNFCKLDIHKYNQINLVEKFDKKDILMQFPVYIYVHSGVALSMSPFGCRWDSWLAGTINILKSKVREMYGIKNVTKKYRNKEAIVKYKKIAEAELEELTNWMNGCCLMCCVRNSDGDLIENMGTCGTDIKTNGISDMLKEYVPQHHEFIEENFNL